MTYVGDDTYKLTRAVISIIEVGIEIGTELLFPSGSHKELNKERWENAKKKGRLRATIKRLERQKLVSWSEIDGKLKLVLTENGEKKVLKYRLEELTIKKPKEWDGLFRVVIFDIPEKKKGVREMFRRKLKELEFQQLQKSVFVTPYECRDEIDFLKNVYEVASCVSYILATDIPDISFDFPKSK